jgi:UDP-N-acetylmuramyl pentapeptide phosphotransferase/UDP-N-acetylglucosamine-1-phosphate transferase
VIYASWGAVLAFLVCGVLVPVLSRLADRYGFVAPPNPDVPTHSRPIPLLGGIAMIAGELPVLLLAAVVDRVWLAVLVALAPVAVLGLYKDRVGEPVSPFIQLLVQAASTLILMAGGLRLDVVADPRLDGAITVVVCLWVINAWNFVDVADGLASSLAIVCALGFVACRLAVRDVVGAAVLAAVAGSSGAFLWFNRPPARIFMGDVGSFSLGVIFSASALLVSRDAQSGAGALLLLAVPLLDVAISAGLRLRAGRSPLWGGREHVGLGLLARGWRTTAVVAFASIVSIALGVAGFVAVAEPELARVIGYRD